MTCIGPRFFGAIWWLMQPMRWHEAFNNLFSGNFWWSWAIAGLIFLPWTSIMYVIVAPGGVTGWEWLWLGLAVFADIAWYSGGAGRKWVGDTGEDACAPGVYTLYTSSGG